jgi:hypothetical protein
MVAKGFQKSIRFIHLDHLVAHKAALSKPLPQRVFLLDGVAKGRQRRIILHSVLTMALTKALGLELQHKGMGKTMIGAKMKIQIDRGVAEVVDKMAMV